MALLKYIINYIFKSLKDSHTWLQHSMKSCVERKSFLWQLWNIMVRVALQLFFVRLDFLSFTVSVQRIFKIVIFIGLIMSFALKNLFLKGMETWIFNYFWEVLLLVWESFVSYWRVIHKFRIVCHTSGLAHSPAFFEIGSSICKFQVRYV